MALIRFSFFLFKFKNLKPPGHPVNNFPFHFGPGSCVCNPVHIAISIFYCVSTSKFPVCVLAGVIIAHKDHIKHDNIISSVIIQKLYCICSFHKLIITYPALIMASTHVEINVKRLWGKRLNINLPKKAVIVLMIASISKKTISPVSYTHLTLPTNREV